MPSCGSFCRHRHSSSHCLVQPKHQQQLLQQQSLPRATQSINGSSSSRCLMQLKASAHVRQSSEGSQDSSSLTGNLALVMGIKPFQAQPRADCRQRCCKTWEGKGSMSVTVSFARGGFEVAICTELPYSRHEVGTFPWGAKRVGEGGGVHCWLMASHLPGIFSVLHCLAHCTLCHHHIFCASSALSCM